VRTGAVLACVALLSACATPTQPERQPQSQREPQASSPSPAPRYNLSGYSQAFKEGYADACARPARQNAERYKADDDYRMGWGDGSSFCKK
jgi:hypothetical protein